MMMQPQGTIFGTVCCRARVRGAPRPLQPRNFGTFMQERSDSFTWRICRGVMGGATATTMRGRTATRMPCRGWGGGGGARRGVRRRFPGRDLRVGGFAPQDSRGVQALVPHHYGERPQPEALCSEAKRLGSTPQQIGNAEPFCKTSSTIWNRRAFTDRIEWPPTGVPRSYQHAPPPRTTIGP